MSVFLLVVGLLLIIINSWLLYKENRSFKTVFEEKQENVNETNELITALRREMAETILELQTEIYEIKNKLNINEEEIGNMSNDFIEEDEYNIEQENQEEDMDSPEDEVNEAEYEKSDESDDGNSFKIAEIERLMKDGYTEDQICEILNIGKGEVLLIRDLYIK